MSLKKIGFAGSQGTGKTTLVQVLLKKLPTFGNYINHQRKFHEKLYNFKINAGGTTVSQSVIAGCHSAQLMNDDKLIFDRTLIDIFAYTDFNRNTASKYKVEIRKMFSELLNEYDIIFYVPIEFKLENDGVRSADLVYQAEIDTRIKLYLDLYEIPYVTLTGTVKQRTKKMMKAIEAIEGK